MLKVTLKNGNEYELLEDTTVYPSGSPNARSRMEIHMGEDAMTTAEFEAAFMDEAATAKIRLIMKRWRRTPPNSMSARATRARGRPSISARAA